MTTTTAHRDGVLVLGESVTFQDDTGTVISATADTCDGSARIIIRIDGDALVLTPRTARAVIDALTGIANTAEMVACLRG